MQIRSGVLQGTVLGPLSLRLYINYSFMLSSEGISLGMQTIPRAETWCSLEERVLREFGMLKCRFDSKLLIVNLEKTAFVTFSCNISSLYPYGSIGLVDTAKNVMEIQSVIEIKYLSISIDT